MASWTETHLVLPVVHQVVHCLDPMPRRLGDLTRELREADRLLQWGSELALAKFGFGPEHLFISPAQATASS